MRFVHDPFDAVIYVDDGTSSMYEFVQAVVSIHLSNGNFQPGESKSHVYPTTPTPCIDTSPSTTTTSTSTTSGKQKRPTSSRASTLPSAL